MESQTPLAIGLTREREREREGLGFSARVSSKDQVAENLMPRGLYIVVLLGF